MKTIRQRYNYNFTAITPTGEIVNHHSITPFDLKFECYAFLGSYIAQATERGDIITDASVTPTIKI